MAITITQKAPAMPEPLRVLDQRYLLGPPLGTGGMATVHLGRRLGPLGFSRLCAIKRLHEHMSADPHVRAMFVDEAYVAARIQHPNVASVLDVAEDSGELFLVMEYVHGAPLSELLHRTREAGRRVPQPVVFAIARDLLAGLHAAHEARTESGEPLGVVHRDVSPQNVLVGADGVARVLDFGIAWAKRRSERTESGQIKGKLTYMAPEQLAGGKVDRRADVYSASLVVWEMLLGEKPFDREDVANLVFRKLKREVERPSNARMSIADAVDAVIVRGFARDPDRRFGTAREMAEAIADYGDPASPEQVADWVADVCGDRLAALRTVVSALERASPEETTTLRIPTPARARPPTSPTLSTPSAASLVVPLPDAEPAPTPAPAPEAGPEPDAREPEKRTQSGTRRLGDLWRSALKIVLGGTVALVALGAGLSHRGYRPATTRVAPMRALAATGPFVAGAAASVPVVARQSCGSGTPKVCAASSTSLVGTRGSPLKKRP